MVFSSWWTCGVEHQRVVDAIDGEVVRRDAELGAAVVIAAVTRDDRIQQHLQPSHSTTTTYSVR